MSESCKMQILGPDANNPKRPARMPSDPKKQMEIKTKLAACRKQKKEEFKQNFKKKSAEILQKGKNIVEKKNIKKINGRTSSMA